MYRWDGPAPPGRADARDDELPPFLVGDPPMSAVRAALELPVLVVIAALVAVTVKALLAQAFYIPSPSMEPLLTKGDRVVVSRTAYRLHEPRRGDVIVFPKPGVEPRDQPGILPVRLGREALEALGVVEPGEEELIKRVVGLPGETVEGRGGHVYVDGILLREPYLHEDVVTSEFAPVTIADDSLWVMGDNRTNSADSRVFGPVPVDSVVGRAVVLAWPPGRAGYL